MAHFGCKHLVSAQVASLPFDAAVHDGRLSMCIYLFLPSLQRSLSLNTSLLTEVHVLLLMIQGGHMGLNTLVETGVCIRAVC